MHIAARPVDCLMALRRYLSLNDLEPDTLSDDSDVPIVDSCDHFHCPYAHPSEKAKWRDSRKFRYSQSACPDFRKGNCRKDDSCAFAHGVFECWLHPNRFRLEMVVFGKDGEDDVCGLKTERVVIECSWRLGFDRGSQPRVMR
ncbi:hypothetical protein GOBAR_AA32622 [Gossypium barbadense]|uniref:C3H1-type domain-containing protein n=1 Tax=Gossypium barbadense TaxID=3634 RepID=A0A2P5WAE8_GOSBA|nr:hypothetical protein GOBAR_AA32622 [Gossypium barbadense]